MSFTADLMAGLAQRLEDEGVGVFNPDGLAYQPTDVGIVLDVLPASPSRVVVLTPYDSADDPTQAVSEVAVQVRVRGTADPRTAYDLDDRVFASLQNLPRTVMGGVVVASAWRTSSGYLGVDANGRHERSSNFRLLVHRPSAHRV